MKMNLIDKDKLITVCENTINNIDSKEDLTDNEKSFFKAANEYMIQVLEACKPFTLTYVEEEESE